MDAPWSTQVEASSGSARSMYGLTAIIRLASAGAPYRSSKAASVSSASVVLIERTASQSRPVTASVHAWTTADAAARSGVVGVVGVVGVTGVVVGVVGVTGGVA